MYILKLLIASIFAINVAILNASDTKNSTTNLLRPKARLVYGTHTTIESFPYLVSILDYQKNTLCGGSILSSSCIITAAHCLTKDPSSYLVRAGSSYWRRDGTTHWVDRITIHPNYTVISLNTSAKIADNDIALLWLANPIKLDNITKKSITMLGSGKEIKVGTNATVPGWGKQGIRSSRSDGIQSLNMKIVDQKKCFKFYEAALKKVFNINYEFKGGHVCVSAPADNVNGSVCSGDSGGPLVIGNKLAGIVSFAAACTSVRFPNVFTEVSHFRDWIVRELAGHSKKKKNS